MKKFLSILLCICVVLTATACGDTASSGSSSKEPGKSATSQSATSQTDVTNSAGEGNNEPTAEPSDFGNVTGNDNPGNKQDNVPTGTEINNNEKTYTANGITLNGIVSMPADGIGTPGQDFKVLESKPVANWDVEPPYYNPLGDYELYHDAGSRTDWFDSMDITYYLEDGITPVSFEVKGFTYEYRIEDPDLTRNYVMYKAKELGAVFYPTDYDKMVAYIQQDDYNGWWVKAQIEYSDEYNTAKIEMCHIKTLPVGQTVTLNPSEDCIDNYYYFYTMPTDNKQLSVSLKFNDYWDDYEQGVQFNAFMEFYVGKTYYSYNVRQDTKGYMIYGRTLCPRYSETFVNDAVPTGPIPLMWELRNEDCQSSVDIMISEIADVYEVEWNEDPALIVIEGAGDLDVTLSPEFEGYVVNHAVGYNFESGARDQNGNMTFNVPSGYYQVKIGEGTMYNSTFFINMIPATGGKITKVTIPDEYIATQNSMLSMFGDIEAEAGNMEIQSIKDEGDTVKIGVLVHDPKDRDVLPELTDFTVSENGNPGVITNVERQLADTNVVLCMDSSGSMEGNMEAAIEAAVKFVESLSDNTNVTLIQFEQKVTVFDGATKEKAIENLRTIKAKGATSLYDATAKALTILEGKDNPYVVVFSDGADSIEPGVAGTGSSINRAKLVELISATDATVLTIGFGSGHDPKALMEISDASVNGAYFMASDKTQLDSAFSQVASQFGNQFVITYTRPVVSVDEAGDVPVIEIMMDVSGSMHIDPEDPDFEGDVDFRIDKIRKLFHDFVMETDDNSLIQFATFTNDQGDPLLWTRQITTNRKAEVLNALFETYAWGGTPITEALNVSLKNLAPISSTKKVLVFFTDAALSVEDDGSGAQQLLFEKALAALKDSGIRVLFAGLGSEEYAAQYDFVFASAAELAGGDYIITSDVNEISAKLNELLQKVGEQKTVAENVNLMISLDCKTDDGSRMNYSAQTEVKEMTIKTQKGKTVDPGVVKAEYAGDYFVYSEDGSQLLYGGDAKDDTRILWHQTYDGLVKSNSFAEFEIKDAYLCDRFKGLESSNYYFLALNFSARFKRADQTTKETGYSIPSIFKHFYVSYNNGKMMPASEATYLAEKPLVTPGQSELFLDEIETQYESSPKEGVVIFLVERSPYSSEDMEQLSFHCYDTTNGHIEIPIVGSMPDALQNMESLPTEAPLNVCDSFSLTLTAMVDEKEIQGVRSEKYEYGEDDAYKASSFRTVEMAFKSNVQALLNIKPQERFYYEIETNNGVFWVPMSNIVNNIPLGFNGKTMLAPASTDTVRMPYIIGDAFKSTKANIVGEVADGSFKLPIVSGNAYSGAKGTTTYENEYFTFTVNEIAYENAEWKDEVILDFTITDKADEEALGTGGIDELFYLERETEDVSATHTEGNKTIIDAVSRKGLGSFGDMSDMLGEQGMVYPDKDDTSELVFGVSYANGSDWGVYEGQSRRGILVFDVPGDNGHEWHLKSAFLEDLDVVVSDSDFSDKNLLATTVEIATDDSFDKELAQKVEAAVEAYRATHPGEDVETVGLSDEEIVGNHIKVPYLTVYGSEALEKVNSMEDFNKLMASLTWMPNLEITNTTCKAPEAVISQGYGTDNDMTELALYCLRKLGYDPSVSAYVLSDAGLDNLKRLANAEFEAPDYILALKYKDETGKAHVYVPAFRTEIENIMGLGSLDSTRDVDEPQHMMARLEVTVSGHLTENALAGLQAAMAADMGSILAGGEIGDNPYETVTLLDEVVDLTECSKDLVDISFVSLGKSDDGVHDLVTAVADTPAGLYKRGDNWIDTSQYRLDRIDIYVDGDLTHTMLFEEGTDLLYIFKTLAINTPELTAEASEAFEKAVKKANDAKTESGLTDYGIARWFTHASCARFVKALADTDRESEVKLNAGIKRIDNMAAFMVTLRGDGNDAIASTDVMNYTSNVFAHYQNEEFNKEDTWRAYNAATGTILCTSEGYFLPDGQGAGYVQYWAALPEDAGIISIDCDQRETFADYFEQNEYPKYLVERLRNADYRTAFVIPTAKSTVNGEEHLVWLEIDTETMETISVFDTGERSAMASYCFGLSPKEMLEFAIGGLVGVTMSHFAVSAYALEFDEYEDIMANAFALMGYSYKCIIGFRDAIEAVKNPTGAIAGYVSDAVKDRYGIDIMGMYKDLTGESLPKPSYELGYKMVIEMYFGTALN